MCFDQLTNSEHKIYLQRHRVVHKNVSRAVKEWTGENGYLEDVYGVPREKKRWWIRSLGKEVGNQRVNWSQQFCMKTQLLDTATE